jgi:hypothetical protein
LQGKFTVAVARAFGQPHGFVTTDVVVHPGIRQVRQAVPVDVSVGQLAAGAHGLVVVTVVVVTVVTVEIWMIVWRTVAVDVVVFVVTTMAVAVVVTVAVVVLIETIVLVVVAPGTGQLAPRQIVVGVRVTPCPNIPLFFVSARPLIGEALARLTRRRS